MYELTGTNRYSSKLDSSLQLAADGFIILYQRHGRAYCLKYFQKENKQEHNKNYVVSL